MNFRIFESAEELARGAAEAIVRRVEHDGARVISLSGGTTPKPVYRHLSSGELRDRLAEFDIIWVVGDERFVPSRDEASNEKMIRETLFAAGMPPGHHLLSFRTDGVEPEESALLFERDWRELGIRGLDLAVLGVGDDGHTASLFPGVDPGDDERIAREVFVEKLSAWRLTLMPRILRAAEARFFLASGANKREVLGRIERGDDLPAVAVSAGTPSTWWFVDRAARGEVERA